MASTPGFREHEAEVTGTHAITILSVFLQDCHACTVQESALGESQRRLLKQGVNLLVIHVQRPDDASQ